MNEAVMSETMLYAIPLRNDEEMRMHVKDFKGRRYVDLRVYFTSKEDNTKIPSKKGVTFNIDYLDEMVKGLGFVQKQMHSKAG